MTDDDASAPPTQQHSADLQEALKRSTSALKAAQVPFALGGGYALWVYGAPEPVHDVDVVVPEDEVEAAAEALGEAGFTIERPPEDWLFKAYWNDAMVDVLHRLGGVPVGAATVAGAEEHEVLGLRIPVLPPTPVMTAKLVSLSEHYCDFAPLLGVVRAIRESLDWDQLRAVSQDRPFAEAFLLLTDRLGISDGSATG